MDTRKIIKYFFSFLFLLGILLISIPKISAETPALAKLSGAEKVRVAKLIEKAKEERLLSIYSAVWRPDIQTSLIPAFRKEYGLSDSDFKFEILSLRTPSIITKVTEELKAKVYKTDIVQNPVAWLNDLVSKGDLMAYDCPEYRHFHALARDPEIAPANPPYFIATEFGAFGIIYNPKHIKEKISHWEDILKPNYKGKISCSDVSKSLSYADAYLALRKVVGLKFFQKLGKLNPFVVVSASTLVNKAASGEYPIVVMGVEGVAYRANRQGAGLNVVMPSEGWAAAAYPAAILARAPHPNASKLFIDFIHSSLGQTLLNQKALNRVGRLGIESRPQFPKPIFATEGCIKMNWKRVSSQDRIKAQEEFRRLVMSER